MFSTPFHPQNDVYHSSIQMVSFETLYSRRCRSSIAWFEIGVVTLTGPELSHEAMKKVQLIRERLKIVQSRTKSYADYLKISPMNGVMILGNKGKLSGRYTYQILRRFGKVAY
ncbi:hypothetical protein MTR67_039518 [Solanum verrucosum]|uniref:Uncharacterized protein n=1 Tax=Solanum verrucosum TaxID=315347 RepID=A0AAF0UH16_SOLVR|nr:hypothetical protein MTR67_039518 [Solanum verrucosum]